MQSTLGADVVATLIAPSVLPVFQMGARIERPLASPSLGPTRVADIVSYWRPAAYDEVTGRWTVVLDGPLDLGEYQIAWRTSDPEPPELEVLIPLTVSRSGAPVVEVGGVYPWAPGVDEVADFTSSYTYGGSDDDRPSRRENDFTDETTPTEDSVDSLIQLACDEIAGRVVNPIPPSQYGLAKATAIQHIKATIAADKQPAGTDDATGEYRGAIARYLSNLETLIAVCRARGGRLY
jgi:hypothetical protein